MRPPWNPTPKRPGLAFGLGLTLLAVAGLAAGSSPARAAEPPVKIETIKVGLGERNQFKTGTWTPLRVQVKAGRDGFEGFMEAVTPDDDGTPTVFRRAISVASGATEWVAMYARPGSIGADIIIQLRDERDRRVGREVSTESLPQGVNALGADQFILATLGNTPGVEMIPTLSGFAAENAARPGPSVQTVGVRLPDGIPARWYGYDGITALVVDTNNKEVMDALDAGRGEALKAWVRGGGNLVLAVGSNWQQVNDSVLEPLLPARPAGRTQLDNLSTLETFAGSTRPITRGNQQVTITRLETIEGRGGKALDAATNPLVVRAPYGFGQVTLVALDVDQKPFAVWEDRGLFWVKAIGLVRPYDESAAGKTIGGAGGQAIYQTNTTDLSTVLHQSLEQFGGVKLVPFGWVAFFIFLYILLIGPGDYFFLKKVLKRMELTWVTFPLIVLTVSLLAYYGAYAVKGTELRINKVDAVDLDQQSGLMRGTTWFTLFSPQNRDYDLGVVPQGLDDPRRRVLSEDGSSVMLSWFGVPEMGFGGMNSSGRLGLSASAYAYGPVGPHQPPDRPETLRQVRVPIWSTKSFIGRWIAPSRPLIESDLQMVGTDRLAGTVTNRSRHTLKNAVLAFGTQVYYDLGRIEPGGSVQVDLKSNRTLAGYLETQGLHTQAHPDPWNAQRTVLPKANLVRSLMFHDAGARPGSMSNVPLHFEDLSGQLALDRPMLVAEIDGPASTLFLGTESQQPRLEQTTVLRVILTLGQGQGRDDPRPASAGAKDENQDKGNPDQDQAER